MNAVIFDLDGTLWDSSVQVTDAWNEVLFANSDGRLQIDLDFMHSVMGKNMDEIMALLFRDFPDLDAEKIYAECMENEQSFLRKNGAVIYPQLEETLKKLSAKYDLAIVSNCQSGYIESFLGYYGFEKYFSDIECFGNTRLEKNENIKLVFERNGWEKAVYVGDTLGDFNFTAKAGLPFVHAAYGFGKVPQAEYRISSLTELPELLEEIL